MTAQPMNADRYVGRAVRIELMDREITQRQLAAATGIEESRLSRLLHGKLAWTLDDLLVVAGALAVETGSLLPQRGALAPDGSHTHVYAGRTRVSLLRDYRDHRPPRPHWAERVNAPPVAA